LNRSVAGAVLGAAPASGHARVDDDLWGKRTGSA
jgi:hypothetical protein